MKPTYTTELTKLDLVLLRDTLDYVLHHFEAEDPDEAQMFELACRDLHMRLSLVRQRAGVPECPTTDENTPEQSEWWSRTTRTDILH